MPDILQLQDAERLDLPDMQFLAGGPAAYARQLGASAMVDPDGALRSYILSGFQPILQGLATARQLRVDRGAAILGFRDRGQVNYGALTTEGDSEKILDLSAFSRGHYAIFIRFELVDAGYANRLLWDPAVPQEFPRNIPTRRVAGWGLTTKQYPAYPGTVPNPGPEWAHIGDAFVRTVVAGDPADDLVLTPKRQLFFEGDEGNSFASAWPGANGRNDDRGLYGVPDFHTFAQAMIKKVEELQSTTDRWWEATVEPLDKKISRVGDLTMVGNYRWNGSGAVATFEGSVVVENSLEADGGIYSVTGSDVGTNSFPFGDVFATTLKLLGASGVVSYPSSTGNWRVQQEADSSKYIEMVYTHLAGGVGAIGVPDGQLQLNVGSDPGLVLSATASSLTVAGSTALTAESAQITAYKDIIPNAAGTTLGTTATRWNAYIDTLTAYTALLPDTTGRDLGDATHRWDAFLEAVTLYGSITPNDDGITSKLGLTTKKFLEAWLVDLYATGKQTLGTGTAAVSGEVRVNNYMSIFGTTGSPYDASLIVQNKIVAADGSRVNFVADTASQAVVKFEQLDSGGKIWDIECGSANDNTRPVDEDDDAPNFHRKIKLKINGTECWIKAYTV